MQVKVKKARRGAPKITITISKVVRDKIKKTHTLPLIPGFPVAVFGSDNRSPRNLIVLRMRRDDPHINNKKIVRIDSVSRKRLGVDSGSIVDVRPLKFETWYHGTRVDPMIIVNDGWIVGTGDAGGPGVYLTNDKTTAQAYAQTALIKCKVAWGTSLNWPNLSPKQKNQFTLWCKEHGLNHEELLRISSPWDDLNILKWARLYGHYYGGGGGQFVRNVRVFPGPIGSGFKPNRVRIIKAVSKDGRTVIWERGRQSG